MANMINRNKKSLIYIGIFKYNKTLEDFTLKYYTQQSFFLSMSPKQLQLQMHQFQGSIKSSPENCIFFC